MLINEQIRYLGEHGHYDPRSMLSTESAADSKLQACEALAEMRKFIRTEAAMSFRIWPAALKPLPCWRSSQFGSASACLLLAACAERQLAELIGH